MPGCLHILPFRLFTGKVSYTIEVVLIGLKDDSSYCIYHCASYLNSLLNTDDYFSTTLKTLVDLTLQNYLVMPMIPPISLLTQVVSISCIPSQWRKLEVMVSCRLYTASRVYWFITLGILVQPKLHYIQNAHYHESLIPNHKTFNPPKPMVPQTLLVDNTSH